VRAAARRISFALRARNIDQRLERHRQLSVSGTRSFVNVARDRIALVNGVHDLGGMHGFGRVAPDDGDAFHAEWEKRCFGIRVATSRGVRVPTTIDEDRYARELLPPHVYLAASYFERWLLSGEDIYVRHGIVDEDELAARRRQLAGRRDADLPSHHDPGLVERVLGSLRRGAPARRELDAAPRFGAGEHVRTRNLHTTRHTRLARYLRDRSGTIVRHHGAFDLPELAAVGEHRPEHVYEVRFEGAELWGDSAEPNTCVYAQLAECHLLPASA
jgi:nitrile hydratase beta subunit